MCCCWGEKGRGDGGRPHQNWIRKCNQGGLIMDGGLFSSASSLQACAYTLAASLHRKGEGKLSTARRIKGCEWGRWWKPTYCTVDSSRSVHLLLSPQSVNTRWQASIWILRQHVSHILLHNKLQVGVVGKREWRKSNRILSKGDSLPYTYSHTVSNWGIIMYLNWRPGFYFETGFCCIEM